MDQDHPDAFPIDPRVEAHGITNEIVHGSECFDARETATGYDQRQKPVIAAGAFGVGFFQRGDELVTEMDRISQCLHRQRIGFESRQTVEVRCRTEGDHELVVLQVMGVVVHAMAHAHRA
jgi:hypothetical protein